MGWLTINSVIHFISDLGGEVDATEVPEHAKKSIGKGEKPSKIDAVNRHITRFRSRELSSCDEA